MLLTVYFCLYSSYKNKVFIFKCVIYSVLYRVQLNNRVLESNLFLSSQLWSKICLTSRFLLMTKKQNRFWVSALVLRENVHLSAEFLNTKVGEFFPLLSGRMSSSLSECTYKKQNRVFFCSLFYGTNLCWIFMLGGERVWWKIYRFTAPWHESLGGGEGGAHSYTFYQHFYQ